MSSTTRIGLVAGASMLAVSTVTIAGAGQDYDARIAKLESELAQLRGDRAEARSEEVRALVNEALADADTRSSLLQSGMVAGWDNGFMLGSADGNYTLKLKGEMQVRFIANLRDNSNDDDTEYGFENARTRLTFAGNVVDQTWGYKVRGAFANGAGGTFGLEDAYITKSMDGMTVKFGQFKPQYLREENIGSGHQQAVERSLTNERYNQDYVQGVELGFAQDNFKASVAVHDGFGSRNSAAVNQQSEFAMNARADLLIAGNWAQFDDYAGWRGQEYGARVGAGVFMSKDAYGTANPNEAEMMGFTVDTQVEGDGWNVAAAFIYQTTDTGSAADPDEMAIVLQGGYFLTDDTEVFARYEWGDDDGTDGFEDLNVLTAGVNYYLAKHNAKLTFDVLFGMDPIGADNAAANNGVQADAANQDGQMAVRGQFQLLF